MALAVAVVAPMLALPAAAVVVMQNACTRCPVLALLAVLLHIPWPLVAQPYLLLVTETREATAHSGLAQRFSLPMAVVAGPGTKPRLAVAAVVVL